MKKTIISLFVFIALSVNSFAQQTVVIQQPGILTDAATAISAPLIVAGGIIEGVLSGIGDIVHGRTTVITNAPPVIPPPPVAHPGTVVVTSPPVSYVPSVVTKQVVSPAGTVTTVTNGGVTSVNTTQVVSGTVVNTQYVRGASVLDTGIAPVPVPLEHRVGTSVYVNPYVYRYR